MYSKERRWPTASAMDDYSLKHLLSHFPSLCYLINNMKFFFLDFVYCCSYPYWPPAKTSPSPPEETRSLSTPLSTPDERPHQSRKWRSLVASRSGSAADWLPSLNTISKDNVLVEREPRASASRSERLIKPKIAPTAKDRPRYLRTPDFATLARIQFSWKCICTCIEFRTQQTVKKCPKDYSCINHVY